MFGKNNTSGVISLTSAEPTDHFEGYARTSYEFVGDESTTDVMLSGPLTDTLKGRIALRYRNMVGWMHNTAQAIANPFNPARSEEHTSELQSLMRISYAVFCLKKKKTQRLIATRIKTSEPYNT